MNLKISEIFYNFEILNFSKPELQLKDTEPGIKSKLKTY